MYRYILCITICAVIWVVNGKWLVQAVRKRIASEIHIHTGLGIFFSLLAVELTLGVFRPWMRFDILWLRIIGLILYIPSGYLVAASMHALKSRGKPESADPTATTTFVGTGIYSIVRQPMTLGMAIWSVALILVFQSILAIILGVISIICFWMSARKEGEYDIGKFGDKYREYIKRTPMWNIFKGLRK